MANRSGKWTMDVWKTWILWKFSIAENSLPKSKLDFGNNAADDTDQDLHYMIYVYYICVLFFTIYCT